MQLIISLNNMSNHLREIQCKSLPILSYFCCLFPAYFIASAWRETRKNDYAHNTDVFITGYANKKQAKPFILEGLNV